MSNAPSQCLSWSWHLECMELERKAGFAAGLDAAREAVNALASTTVEFHGPLPVVHNVRITDALAAIDALRGES